MSASQRLKALKELQDRNPHVYILNDSLLRAYPQILALVEAVELWARNPDGILKGPFAENPNFERFSAEEWFEPKLSALDEALS